MTDGAAHPRPAQVTFGGWVILLGSLFALVSVYETVAGLRSIDTREGILKSLDEPPLDGMGLDLQEVLDFMHGTALVAGACAAAMAILGGYVLRRNRAARLGLTILALPMFLTGMVAGGFATSMVAVAVGLLWTAPARDWFDGKPPRQPAREVPRAADAAPRDPWGLPPQQGSSSQIAGSGQPAPTGGGATAQDTLERPPAFAGFGTPAGAPSGGTHAQRPSEPERPRQLGTACMITWVLSSMIFVAMGAVAIALGTSESLAREMWESDDSFDSLGVSVSSLRGIAVATSAVFALWSLAAMVLAVFTYRGHEWARWTLFVSAVVAAIFSLTAAVSVPMVLAITGLTVYAAVLLTRPSITHWMIAKKRSQQR
ncbi:hypothetical protein NODU109028_11130 [Nocardioides dubius]|uniref:DUF4064 domain-containing protein n=1 Tax=Nocardioides dubius TaxID=317019 RepID=A0ABP4EBX1_9ACTN